MAQTAALLSFLSVGKKADASSIVYFIGIDGVRFKRPVVPGDQVKMDVEILRCTRGIWKYKAIAHGRRPTRRGSRTDVHHAQRRRREPSRPEV